MSDAIQRFYAEEYDESERLTRTPHGRLESARTRELLAAALPEGRLAIVDVGGGTGQHAEWLVDLGHEVTVIDIVESHVAAARSLGIDAEVGDARRLDRGDGTVDVVLLLGPLYHLDEVGRATALSEAHRVLRPGGLLAAAAISRWAALIDVAATSAWDDDVAARLRTVVETGVHDPTLGFTTSWCHTPEQLEGEVSDAGLIEVEVIGVEGPMGHLVDHLDLPDTLERAIAVARMTERVPDLRGASPHLLSLARKAGPSR